MTDNTRSNVPWFPSGLFMVVLTAVTPYTHWLLYFQNGLIAGIGKSGNPDVMDCVSPASNTTYIDRHVTFVGSFDIWVRHIVMGTWAVHYFTERSVR